MFVAVVDNLLYLVMRLRYEHRIGRIGHMAKPQMQQIAVELSMA